MFGFCATSLSAIFWPSLLPFAYVAPGVVLLLTALIRKAWVLSGALLSVLWISGFAHSLLNYQTNSTANIINVRAEIIALVSQERDWISADIRLVKPELMYKPDQYMRIYWRTTSPVYPNQVYDFKLKAKSITNVLNQGGFNQQKHFLSRHVIGRANVKHASLVSAEFSVRNSLRRNFIEKARRLSNADLLSALLFGDKTRLSAERWQQLRHSGTGHLISISGLHLSVVGGWTFLILFYGLSRFSPCFGLRNLYISVAVSLMTALGYAYLAGFSIPTQRALIMLTAVLGLSVFERYSSPWERLLLALFLVLFFDPMAMLSAGLWLSFIAISVILLSISYSVNGEIHLQQISLKAKARQLALIQCGISVILGVAGCILFGGASLHSVWVNLIVVPIFSVFVIPLALVGFVIWSVGLLFSANWLLALELANISLDVFSWFIAWVDALPLSWFIPADRHVMPFILSLAGVGIFIVQRFSYRRWIALLFFAPAGLQLVASLTEDKHRWYLHMLDVGQGLAMVIENNGRSIIYDTGARFGDFSYAKRSVIPFLQARGINQIDKIIISHGDNDHRGGLNALTQYAPDAEVVFNSSKIKATACSPRQERWQGIKLDYLWPVTPVDSNDGSCVIRIDDGQHTVLLTGDIERFAENEILNMKISLQSDVMLAPHHGSKTSSSAAFISAVSPEIVLVAAGYQNHWGFPKTEIVERYLMAADNILVSGNEGQLTLIFEENRIRVQGYRTDIAPYWYNQLFKFAEFR